MMKDRKKGLIFGILLFVMMGLVVPGQISANAKEAQREASIYEITTDKITGSTRFDGDWTYSSETPTVVNFWDSNDIFHVASYNEQILTINRFNADLSFDSSITIENPYSYFGTICCDDSEHYYVVWAQSDEEKENKVVTSLIKYDYSGNELGRCEMKGYDCDPYGEWAHVSGQDFGTMIPFKSGNCKLAYANGVICCNYARKMYSGHQSNFVFFVNTETMERLYENNNVPYCSHSFDQDVIATSDGGYLVANHGDANDRGFEIAKINYKTDEKTSISYQEKCIFHFREGANRDHGYNETYAQLGGLCETDNTYVLCGSSEKTLSFDTAPTNQAYCGHSEARDLFVQILKKDFYGYIGENMYFAKGVTRVGAGTKPETSLTNLYLDGNEVDYGVIWLTELDEEHYVCNPKVVSVDDGKFVVIWEELSYNELTGESYYEVLDESGNIVVEKTRIPNTYLMGNTPLTYHNECIYWTTNDENGQRIHQMDVSEHRFVARKDCEDASNHKYECLDCDAIWENGPSLNLEAGHQIGQVDYYWSDDYKTCEVVLKCSHNYSHTEKHMVDVTSEVVSPGYCNKQGKTKYIASYGEYVGEVEVYDIPIDPKKHQYLKYIQGSSPDCTHSGLSWGRECYYCGAVVDEQKVIPAKGHQFSTSNIVEPSCETEGLSRTGSCLNCGENITTPQVIPALGHDLIEWSEMEANCGYEGTKKYYSCMNNNCDKLFLDKEGKTETTMEELTIPKNPDNHVGGSYILNDVAATCKDQGYTGDTYCYMCRNKKADGTVIPKDPNNHIGETHLKNVVTATCIREGYSGDSYCSGCDVKLAEGEKTNINLNQHEGETYRTNEVKATCEKEGYSGEVYCSSCDCKISDGNITEKNPNNHTGTTYLKNAMEGTCVQQGYEGDCYCDGCNIKIAEGRLLEKNPNNHVGDTYRINEVNATCKEEGYTGDEVCGACGEIIQKGTSVPKITEHQYSFGVCAICNQIWCDKIGGFTYRALTEEKEGKLQGKAVMLNGQKCLAVSVVGVEITNEEKIEILDIVPLDNGFLAVVTKLEEDALGDLVIDEIQLPETIADLGKNSLKGAKVVVCTAKYPPAGLKEAVSEEVVIRVSEESLAEYQKVLGTDIKLEIIHIHTFASEYQFDSNYHWKEATCGHKSAVKVVAHTMSDWKEIVAATELISGIERRSCYCGYEETREIAKLEHTMHQKNEGVIILEPDCINEGSIVFDCKICNEYIETESIPALGHNWGTGIIEFPNSLAPVGYKKYVCLRCGATKKEEIRREVKKEQKITVTGKCSKTVVYKASKLKKKSASIKISAKAKGKLTYKVIKGSSKYIKVSSKGNITLKKKCKKGTYKILISAKATNDFNEATRTIVIKVK